MNRFKTYGFLALLFILFWGCDTFSGPGANGRSGDETAEALGKRGEIKADYVRPFKTHDEFMLHIAKVAPGFGGVYLDEAGRPNIFLKDPSDQAAAMKVLDEMTVADPARGRYRTSLARKDRAALNSALIVHQADYDLLELNVHYEKLKNFSTGFGVVSVSLDEGDNRLSVAFETEAERSAVEASLGGLDIPADMILFDQAEPVQDMLELDDRVRPVAGGLRGQRENHTGACTIGYTTFGGPQDVAGFVTASHCTQTMGQVDGENWYQKSNSTSNDKVGEELVDPPFLTRAQSGDTNCPNIPSTLACRYSDAAFVKFTISGNSNRRMDRIIPTTGKKTGEPGSTTISTTNSSNWLVGGDVVYYAIENDVVDKIGFVSGWTYGEVKATGVEPRESQTNHLFRILDADKVEGMYLERGDSGSMVFYDPGNGDAILYGVLFQGNEQINYYSPIRHVEDELQLDL